VELELRSGAARGFTVDVAALQDSSFEFKYPWFKTDRGSKYARLKLDTGSK